jgi:hypothetical protein
VSSSNRPSKRPSRVKARSAKRPGVKAKRPEAKRAPVSANDDKRPTADVQKRTTPSSRQSARQASPARAQQTSTPSLSPRPALRLPGPATSRLTIKPGPPVARPQLELSTRRRPPGPQLLSQVELDEDEVLIDSFDAILDGVRVRITAVLERTCVYVDSDGDRRLAPKNDLWVEADKLPIRRRRIVQRENV